MILYGRRFLKGAVAAGAILFLVLLVTGCFLSAPTGALVTPTIRAIGLPDASIVNSVTLTVRGPGMDPVEVSYSSLPSTINIAVPEGNDRVFELSVGLNRTFTENPAIPYTSYKGTAMADVTSDSAVVKLTMGIGSTKIIVPDTYNNRLVQIDDMSGAGWTELKGSDIASFGNIDSNFVPSDVDYDEYGNIYVANDVNGTVYGGIWRFTSITDTTPIPVLSSAAYGMKAVAVDRENDKVYGLYYNSQSAQDVVYYNDYAGSLGAGTGMIYSINGDFGSGIYSICADSGYLYVAGERGNPSSTMVIRKYWNSNTTAIVAYDGSAFEIPEDMLLLENRLYVSIGGGDPNTVARIEKFDLDLNHASGTFSLGSYADDPTGEKQFAGPGKFLATMNDTLTVMDGNTSGNNLDSRLVSFDNIAGDDWKPFGSYGSGYFHFMFSGGQ